MTTRREIKFQSSKNAEKPKPVKARVEVLTARAARLAYLTVEDISYLVGGELSDHPLPPVDTIAVPQSLRSFTHSIRSVNLESIVQPLLQRIQGLVTVFNNETTGCQVVVFPIFNELWISFRGTQLKTFEGLKKDLMTDLKFQLKNASYLHNNFVHTGFDESYMSVRNELLEEIKIQFDKMGKAAIRLIGHSLGGGLATIMALDLKYRDDDASIATRTFGSPCVGDKAFVECFDSNIFDSIRYAIHLDPVPLLLDNSLSETLYGYHHVAELSKLNELSRKHNIDYYLKILCQRAHLEDEIEDIEEFSDIEEEDIIHNPKNRKNILFIISIVLIGTIAFYHKSKTR